MADKEVATQKLDGIKNAVRERLVRVQAISQLQTKHPEWQFGRFLEELQERLGEEIIDLRDGTEANRVITDALTRTINEEDGPQLLKEFASGLLQKLQINSTG